MHYKNLFTIIFCITLLSACSTGVRFNPAQIFKGKQPKQVCEDIQLLSEQQAQLSLDNDIYQFQHDVEHSLVYREKFSDKLAVLNKLTQEEKPFSPDLIDKLSQSINKKVELMQPILTNVAKHSCWLEHKKYQVSDAIKLKGSMLMLATLVVLYDDYGTVFAVISENDRLRRFINHADSGYERDEYLLESITNRFVDTDMLSYTTLLIAKYHDNKTQLQQLAVNDENLDYLIQIIEQSKSYPALRDMNFFDAANHRRKVRRRVTSDTLNEINRTTINALSEGFSNTVGDYEERKGMLYEDDKITKQINEQLQIGDILLEKTPFRLTDRMIPGHWGHAAIWVGNEQELKAIDLWQHPLVVKYHKQIKQGQLIAESLRTGTQLSSLAHFLNVDDFAIVRAREPLSKQQMQETILLALRQIGKAYDFNFDVETTDKIVCSQLVYLSYSKINWPTESTLGRYTISPDNIAVKALNNSPFELINFYHNGELVHENSLNLMESLMVH